MTEMELQTTMAMHRTPSYFVWPSRKHVSSSPRHSTPRSRKQGMTSNSNMNARSSPGLQDVSTDGISGRDGGGDDSGPSPSKMRSPHPRSSGVGGTDTQSVDTRLSGVSGESDSHTQSAVSISPKHKDPDRIKKDREREERVRLARERLEEERKKKLVELQDQQRQAQENREKQLEMRRQKIEDLRRRDTERRAAVEERRRAKEDADRSRRETLLIKAEERVARYEQWRRTGQKGGRSHCLGFGSATPRAVCQPMERPRRSSSHSALMRRSPNGSDSDYSFRPQRRALSACSTIRRHCCVDINRMGSLPTPKHLSVSTSVLYHKRNTDFSSAGMLNISSRPESLVALNTIPEGRRSFLAAMGQLPSRPKSVMTLSGSSTGSASSVVPGGGVRLRETKTPRKPRPASVATSMPSFVAFEPARPSPRSKSSDRLARERSKTRVKSARQSAEKEEEKVEEGKEMVKTAVKTSRGTIDRLSTPKQSPAQGKETATTKRESPVRISPRKAFSTTNLTVPRKKPSIKERPAKEASGKPKHPTPVALAAAAPAPEDASPSTPVVAPTPAATATPTSAVATRTPTRVQSPVLAADEDGGSGRPVQTATPGSAGEITAEEYKAKLAEKRRQAREKAEREAEEERRRQEEIQRQEEERRRQEEEEQRRLEEEALRLAEEARKAEEERLRKAIEAEEQRKAEEAARLEQERLAKEESERKAKEEAERLEQERLEKARRDEEERLERKKRLEMIMKRVKTDAPVEGTKETPIKAVTGSPTKNMSSNNSSDSSPTEPEGKGVPEASPAPSEKQDEAEPRSENMESEENQPPVSASLLEAPTQAPPHAKEPDSSTVICIEEEKAEPSPVLAQSNMVFSAMYSPVAASVEMENGGERPKFKSPLLQKLVEGKEDAGVGQGSGGTRFKSPLLQNLLGKTKVGARIGIDRQDHSVSTPDLSSLDRSGASGEARGRGLQPASDAMSASMVEVGGGDASSRKEVMNSSEEKDVDTSEDSSSSSHSSPSHSSSKSARMVANGDGLETSLPLKTVSFVEPIQQIPDNGTEEAMDVSGIVDASAHVDMASSGASFWSEQDSGASFGSDSMRPGASASPLQVSLNGHGLLPHSRLEHAGLEDSSISMRSVESGTTSITDSATGSIFSSVSSLQQSQVQLSVGGDRDFEELIDLTISKKTATSDASDDLINFNKFEDGSEKTSTVPPPIIAFEEPATTIRRQDVKDLLS